MQDLVKKKGRNSLDLLKAIHYTILLIHFSRSNEESEGEAPVDKKVHNVFELDGETKHYEIKTMFEDEEYSKMIDWMKANNVDVPSCRFGAGSNARMRRIAAYNKAKGIKASMNHGKKRGVYYSPCTNESVEKIVKKWYDRWGKPRYERVKDKLPPYKNGLE